MPDLKITSARFHRPVELKGLGMVDRLNDEVGGWLASFIVESRMVRIVTTGETWVPVENVSSFHVSYPDRGKVKASK